MQNRLGVRTRPRHALRVVVLQTEISVQLRIQSRVHLGVLNALVRMSRSNAVLVCISNVAITRLHDK